MKRVVLLSALLVSPVALAADMGGMKMDGHNSEHMSPAHKASGTVKGVDAAKGVITIAHGAVASANWPAMKMNFTIAPEMLNGVSVGDQIEFEFTMQGMKATVTKMAVAK